MSVNILCIGDVMLGENLNHYKRSIRTKFHPDYRKLIPADFFTYMEKEVDLVFYNLEYSIAAPEDFLSKTAQENIYKGTPETLSLFEGNKMAVSIANNHFAQHGAAGCVYTKQLLQEKGIHIIGETNRPTLISVKDKLLHFYGVTLVKDKHGEGNYFKSSYEQLIAALSLPLASEKKSNEYWVLSIHWGDEYLDTPSQQQSKLAKELIDRGFDLLIGHHPHTLQPVEFYKDKLIIYSLGNFIFDQNFSKRTQRGLVLNVSLQATPFIQQAFFSIQRRYRIRQMKKVKTEDLLHRENFRFYRLKKKMFSQWYRILMKIEVLTHLYEVDKETLNDFLINFRNKWKGKRV